MTENQQEPTQLEKSSGKDRHLGSGLLCCAGPGVPDLLCLHLCVRPKRTGHPRQLGPPPSTDPDAPLLFGWFTPNTTQPPRSRVLGSLSGSGSPPANHDSPGGIK